MKAPSQQQGLRVPHHGRQHWPARLLAPSLAGIGLALLVNLGSGSIVRATTQACGSIKNLAFSSCLKEAEGTKLLTKARCANIPDRNARNTCIRQAETVAKEEQRRCKDHRNLRKQVCARLGPAPYAPVIDPANFPTSTTIDNPFFPLPPGTTFVYEGQTADGFEHVEFAVTHGTRVILGITCVEVHDTRRLDGVLTEDTRDWFAQDKDASVWYFGENTTLVANGLPIDLSGTWTGGVDSAQPGLIMETHPAIGDFYRQEFLVGEAEDLAEVLSLTASASTPYTSCSNDCLETEETSPLKPGDVEHKFYKMGVGYILTIDLATQPPERSELVNIITK
jgi:hypothetical protein